ncbi:hypothetical protein THAOC_10552, partial [Thalassiosira oceanica]
MTCAKPRRVHAMLKTSSGLACFKNFPCFSVQAVRFIPSPIGTFQNPLYGVKSFAIAALEKKRLAAEVALLGCYTAGEVTCVTLGSVAKAYVWALFFAAKLAKKAVDIAREDVKLPETMTKEGFEYNEATYHNVIRQYEWLVTKISQMTSTS